MSLDLRRLLVMTLVSLCPMLARADDPPAPERGVSGKPYRAICLQISRVDWIEHYEKSIDEIAANGADTLLLSFSFRQENASSEVIFLDVRITPTTEQLGRLIDHAKEKKLRVILHPILLLQDPADNDWRGTIHPDDWGKWFQAYREIMVNFADCGE